MWQCASHGTTELSMFERMSERARRVLFFARDEVSQLGSMSIDTEHLLLGLIRESKGLANRLFASAGMVLDDIRDDVLRRVPARSRTSPSAEIPFSAAANRVLQHAAQEATGCDTMTSGPSTCCSDCSVNTAASPPTC
jgi:ATP-dependent Clp protease ATP-binding subunit ClpC